MTQITNTDEVRHLGTILGIWAHPDDETFMMGGLMAMASQNGQKVACITATKGEKGSEDPSEWSTLGETRAAELEAGLKILGVSEHQWLGYIDAECYKIADETAVAQLAEDIRRFRPDTIITFAPDGSTGHPDHISISRWTVAAARLVDSAARVLFAVDSKEQYDAYLREIDEKFDIYFNVFKPAPVPKEQCDLILCLTPEIATKKFDALAAMPSQTEDLLKMVGRENFKNIVDCETFVESTTKHNWAVPKSEKIFQD